MYDVGIDLGGTGIKAGVVSREGNKASYHHTCDIYQESKDMKPP